MLLQTHKLVMSESAAVAPSDLLWRNDGCLAKEHTSLVCTAGGLNAWWQCYQVVTKTFIMSILPPHSVIDTELTLFKLKSYYLLATSRRLPLQSDKSIRWPAWAVSYVCLMYKHSRHLSNLFKKLQSKEVHKENSALCIIGAFLDPQSHVQSIKPVCPCVTHLFNGKVQSRLNTPKENHGGSTKVIYSAAAILCMKGRFYFERSSGHENIVYAVWQTLLFKSESRFAGHWGARRVLYILINDVANRQGVEIVGIALVTSCFTHYHDTTLAPLKESSSVRIIWSQGFFFFKSHLQITTDQWQVFNFPLSGAIVFC